MVGHFCFCGDPAVLKTSWTDGNPGRRFFGCSKYGTNGACNYFRWHDPALDEHMKFLVLNFHRRIREQENRQNGKGVKSNGKTLSIFFVFALVFFCIWIGK
ncbi:unnamed protein product [Linum tenue]|uniref:GRF-type domain-containing protein n=1 Tax=Linum tenue TaxID=586396 RepID=A0AAV0R4L4_9ROSI|nr:unnamed protein product [Linum tenue]